MALLRAGVVMVAEDTPKVQQSARRSTDSVCFNWNSPLNSFCLSISAERESQTQPLFGVCS